MGITLTASDPDGDPLNYIIVSDPRHGTLSGSSPALTYTPATNYNGPDSFTFKVNDGTADSNVATVSITVSAANDAPVATDDVYNTPEDTPLVFAAPGVLGNDQDLEGGGLTAEIVGLPSHGAVALNADGSFTYTPVGNYTGPDSFTYKAKDAANAESNVATVSITVTAANDAPVATMDTYNTDEDASLTVTAPGVLFNDNDPDSPALTAILVSGPSHGNVTLSLDGSFIYTPNTNYTGTDTFTYKANDGTADSNPAMVQISVNAVNDAPVATTDNYGTNEDSPLTRDAVTGVLSNDTDIDTPVLTAEWVSGPSHGALTLNSDGSFLYTPTLGYYGADTFYYRAYDGTTYSSMATVNIIVGGINDVPVAVNDSFAINEDASLNVAAPGVLDNDTDPENDPLTAVLVSGPAHGALSLNANGSFTYTPCSEIIMVRTALPTRPTMERLTPMSPPSPSPSTQSTIRQWPMLSR